MRTEDYEQKAIDFMEKTGTKIKFKSVKYDYHFFDDTKKRNIFKIVIKRNGKQMTIHFGQSYINTELGNPPAYYDILVCLTTEDPGTFDDFCDCFGYDRYEENTRKKECMQAIKTVCTLFLITRKRSKKHHDYNYLCLISNH